MRRKRLWIALVVCICVITIVVMSAEKSRQADAGGVIDPTCTSSSPCIEYDNNGSGPGVRGVSIGGNGLAGATKFHSTSLVNSREGLSGSDISTSGSFNAGVRGLSVRGFGVTGQSTSGNGIFGISTSSNGVVGRAGAASNIFVGGTAGVWGDSNSSTGVIGTSVNFPGVYAQSTTSAGVRAASVEYDGVFSTTAINSSSSGLGYAGVAGADVSLDGGHLDRGLFGYSVNGAGAEGFSISWVGVEAVGGSASDMLPALSVSGNRSAGTLINACATANPCPFLGSVFSITTDGSIIDQGNISSVGNVYGGELTVGGALQPSFGSVNISGQYQKSGTCLAGCAPPSTTSQGRAVVSYVPTQSLPTIDDFGEATLQNGYAYVRLDPSFANVIDKNIAFLVFITPEGDSQGLYVTQKTARGFAVRENMGGHSSLAFSYRIVAKPLGNLERRLPMVVLPRVQRRVFLTPRFYVPNRDGREAVRSGR